MSDQTWTCAACRAHNRADQDRCPGCDAPRPASTRPVGRLVGGLVLVVAVGLSLAIARPGAGGDASGTSGRAPGSGGPPGSAVASASPAVSPDPAGASPSPAPAATPVPYTGRLSGTFLVTFDEGLYPSGELLVVKPSCAAGPCSASVRVVDPRTGVTLRSGVLSLTADGYRMTSSSTALDICREPDGLTVEAGVEEKAVLTLRAVAMPESSAVWLAGTRRVAATLTARGTRVGCEATTSVETVTAMRLVPSQLASAASLVGPRPLPDLVGLPTYRTSVPGATMVYYAITGDRASVLLDRWATASSRPKNCGTVDYPWFVGDPRTLSCALFAYQPRLTKVTKASTGVCKVTAVSTKASYTVPIARWTGPDLVPRLLVDWWEATQEVVAAHEAGHFDIDRKWIATLKSKVVGAACADAPGIVDRWAGQLQAAQEAYDRKQYASQVWPQPPATVY